MPYKRYQGSTLLLNTGTYDYLYPTSTLLGNLEVVVNENKRSIMINDLDALLAAAPAKIIRYSVGSLPEPGKPFSLLSVESVAIKISLQKKHEIGSHKLIGEKIKIRATSPLDDSQEVMILSTVSDTELVDDLLTLKFSPPARIAIFENNPWLGSDGSIDLDYYDSYEAHVDEYEILSRYEGTVGSLYTPAESPSILVSYAKIELSDINPEHFSFFKKGKKISGRTSMNDSVIQPFSGSRSYSTEIKMGFEDREFSAVIVSSKKLESGRLLLDVEGFTEELFGDLPTQNLSIPK